MTSTKTPESNTPGQIPPHRLLQHNMTPEQRMERNRLIKLDMMETEYAIDVLRRSIEAQPSRVEHYGMLANIFRRQGNLEEALKVLNAANLAVSGTSAEIQYNLGLINLERGDYPAALGSAQAAYRLGYPLPWLKDKLTQLGVWKD